MQVDVDPEVAARRQLAVRLATEHRTKHPRRRGLVHAGAAAAAVLAAGVSTALGGAEECAAQGGYSKAGPRASRPARVSARRANGTGRGRLTTDVVEHEPVRLTVRHRCTQTANIRTLSFRIGYHEKIITS